MADDQDKTEKPTSFRLQEAREKGQVARSTELSSVITLAFFCFALISGLTGIVTAMAAALRASIALAGAEPQLGPGFAHWMSGAFAPVWHALGPAIFALVVAAIAINVLQTGVIFTTTPLKPDPSRLNPIKGFKRIFSLRTFWDLSRLLLKLAILSATMFWMTRALWRPLMASAAAAPSTVPWLLSDLFAHVTKWLLLVLGFIAMLDLLFSRKEFIRKLRMSRRELKDEHKRHDGDPGIRSKRRRLAREILTRIQSVARVSAADVIVTNPTHVAIALQYRTARMQAPIVLSKGSGWLSARIRKIGAQHGVPIVRSPALARALFKECAIDAAIPAHRYGEVGGIYRWVMARPGHRVHS
ncbi:EscU/YscU/HrcU family type III secretion system export apparatus switch protein [Dyella silvatica]|uniref:EscU/YscU/HrcU family type III secretion system export apparatus switch protein n=1 Tax=Dyella silvatica TaxID=2992128 RepID=UPI00225102ED|nr:EscU/YscU/HrcU family type III secretion system export apparatus switch protein [Dyella silvatica]